MRTTLDNRAWQATCTVARSWPRRRYSCGRAQGV